MSVLGGRAARLVSIFMPGIRGLGHPAGPRGTPGRALLQPPLTGVK